MVRLFLGIDLGSSACKAVLADESGRIVSIASEDCAMHQPEPTWQEQSLDEIYRAMIQAVRNALLHIEVDAIRAISFSSAMHGMMAVDDKGKPLMRMLTWADGRSRSEVGRLRRKYGSKIYKQTGCPLTALYYPARILWLKHNQPEIFKGAYKFLSIKDAIVHRRTGRWTTDRSHSSSNGLLDIHSLKWNERLLSELGISTEQLPELCDSDSIVGELKEEPARLMGLKPGIPVVPGAGDGGLANLGSGAIDAGQLAITIGSSGAVRKILSKPYLDRKERTWCYYLADGRWYAGGAINNGGIILHWLRDAILSAERDLAIAREIDPFESIVELANSVPAGAEGLLFLPYIYGERAPYWNPLARGVIFGLSPHHRKAHIARATIEGICMCIAHILELLSDSPGGLKEIRASGGFIRSESWVQILADVLGRRILLPDSWESSAFGAIILGMKAVSHIKSLSSAREMISIKRIIEPDIRNHRLYRERFYMFKELYKHIERDFFKWAEIQRGNSGEKKRKFKRKR